MAVPHAPMQENRPPTQQNFCATLIIPGIPVFYKGKSPMGLCAGSGCAGTIIPAQPFYSPRQEPLQGGGAARLPEVSVGDHAARYCGAASRLSTPDPAGCLEERAGVEDT